MTAVARVVSVNVNPAGGVPKRPVPEAALTPDVVAGDRQRNRKFHGGPTRAVCLFSHDRIDALRAEGHPISPGSTGENLTIVGLDWDAVRPGVRLRVGDAVVEITEYTTPCGTIAASFRERYFQRLSQDLYPGWSRVYARIVTEAAVRPGDVVEIIDARDGGRGAVPGVG